MLSDENIGRLMQEIQNRRKMIAVCSKGYCSKCGNRDALYTVSFVADGSSECEECYKNRRAKELSETIENIKQVKLQVVRKYFRSKSKELYHTPSLSDAL